MKSRRKKKNKEKVVYERVKKIGDMIGSDGSGLCSQTPNGVLEVSASCFSFKTHDSSSSSHTTHLS
ncbi:BnaA09g52490D [Brassica napus]|uniref:BnaA09g52490D protein n=1 Tax=Brassica napus TaxID=3708 RepID=A0A078IXA5_BRANA|nr:BnaA09g52490D [Brassica napus]